MDVIDRLGFGYLEDVVRQWETHSDITLGELFELVAITAKPAQRNALSADLISKGMRLRNFPSDDYTWADLKTIVRFLDVHSALFGVMFPDRAGWDLQNLLLAEIVDHQRWLQWAKTKDGSKGRNRPKQVPRPGVTPEQPAGAKVAAQPLSQLKARLAKRYAAINAAETKKKLTAGLGRRVPPDPPKASLEDIFGRG